MARQISCNLKALMEKEGINNYQLSKRLAVADNTIRGYAKNKFSRIDAEVAIKICDYFQVELGEMFQIIDS